MTDTATVRQVIRYLGWLALFLVFGTIMLAFRIIDGGKITPEQVSVLTPIVGLAGTSLGAIGALLVSTHSVDPPPTPEQQTAIDPAPDEGQAEVHGVILTALAIALGLIIWSVIGAHTTLY